jgi:hypothetical protein
MSQGFTERKFFLNWQEYIFDINNGVEYYDNYTNSSLIVLTQIDTTNSKIYNTQFIGAYPTNVGSIDYSWEADGNYVKQQVSFSYYRMLSEGVVYTQPKQSTSLTQTALNPDILNSNTKTIAMTPGAIT